MDGNSSLTEAKRAKKDEFYTQFQDIAAELRHYGGHFRGKTVLCNCDDPYESNFFKYFALKFNELGLRRLICTCYDGSPIAQTELRFLPSGEPEQTQRKEAHKAYHLELTEVSDMNGDGAVDLRDVEELLKRQPPERLEGNGDFRSRECLALLEQADIVVTNPPFSLFREYLAKLIEYGKKFLIIGNQNAITYKEVFPLIKENKLWLGVKAGDMAFKVPEHYEARDVRYWQDESGQKWRSLGNICWFTNLDHSKRHEPLDLYKHYTPEEYPRYDNYDAINVDKTSDIPLDYQGVMGVPITFLDKYCPEQFEILGLANSARYLGDIPCLTIIQGQRLYNRIFIKRKAQ
ncbi:MAG: adenine-specific methyltransferase EcoRI family protein [Prevotellaceae bacterium]|nr:adenine-specific methyltransferase EcoRI family protein [Prevotellaceae bacterium]